MINPMNDLQFLGVLMPDGQMQPQKPLAMAFIQNQEYPDIMDTDLGFCTGTIFKGLDKPFHPQGAVK